MYFHRDGEIGQAVLFISSSLLQCMDLVSNTCVKFHHHHSSVRRLLIFLFLYERVDISNIMMIYVEQYIVLLVVLLFFN